MTQKSHTKRHSKKIPINIQTIRKERVEAPKYPFFIVSSDCKRGLFLRKLLEKTSKLLGISRKLRVFPGSLLRKAIKI